MDAGACVAKWRTQFDDDLMTLNSSGDVHVVLRGQHSRTDSGPGPELLEQCRRLTGLEFVIKKKKKKKRKKPSLFTSNKTAFHKNVVKSFDLRE